MEAPRSRRALAVSIALLTAAPMVVAWQTPPASADAATVWDVHVGRPEPLRDLASAYLGTDETLAHQRCVNRQPETSYADNVAICRHRSAGEVAESYIRLRSTTADPDARAGWQVAYRLKRNCVGQQLTNDMEMVATYHRSVTVDFLDTLTSKSEASAEVRLDPLTGDVRPRYPSTELGLPLERWLTPSTASGTVTKSVLVPHGDLAYDGVYTALLYGHAHASVVNPQEDTAWSWINVDLNALTADWVDTVDPTTSFSLWDPDGHTVGYVVNGRTWYPESVLFNLHADDDFSCPRYVHHRLNAAPGDPWQVHWPGYGKAPHTFGGWDGAYDIEFYAEDWQGNTNAVTTRKVGIDTLWPEVWVNLTPAAPNGHDGWYGGSAPVARIECSDATSGCWQVGYRNMQFPGGRWVSGSATSVSMLEGRESWLECKAQDHARNVRDWWCSAKVKVDVTRPDAAFACAPAGGAPAACDAARWHNVSVETGVSCSDALSGCESLNVSWEAGEARAPYAGPRAYAAEGRHAVAAEATDVAQNARQASTSVNLDFTPPSATGVSLNTARHYVDVIPTWTLAATDGLSGVAKFVARVDNGTEFDLVPSTPGGASASATHRLPSTVSDGPHCLVARAVDAAGNAGAASVESCFHLDRAPARSTLLAPVTGGVYVNDQRLFSTGLVTAIALGRITFEATATDPGTNPSGLATFRLRLDGSDAWRGPGVSNECPLDGSVCRQRYDPPFLTGNGLHEVAAVAIDRAGAGTWSPARLLKVNLVGVSGMSSGLAYGRLLWEAVPEGQPFGGYEIHRSLTPGFTPGVATRVATLSDPAATEYVDAGLVPDTTYYYELVYLDPPASGEGGDAYAPLRVTNEFPVRTPPFSTGGGGESIVDPTDGRTYPATRLA